MALTWSELRRALQKEVSGWQAEQAFRKATAAGGPLAALASPQAAVAWLLAFKSHPREEEDAVLSVLRGLAGADPQGPWPAVLFLGLWPTMEWAFHHVRVEGQDDQARISALWGGLEEALEKEEVWDRAGIALRLRYFVWGRAKRVLHADEREQVKLRAVAAHEEAGLPKQGRELLVMDSPTAWPAFANRSPQKDDADAGEILALRRLLTDGLDLPAATADLLIRHFVRGETLAELASEYGISPVACRQRCSRAVGYLRRRKEALRRHAVTLAGHDDMERWEGAPDEETPERSEGCPGPWMN
jgi:DNA-directed RNA polymerase specialized sigma24 family protein